MLDAMRRSANTWVAKILFVLLILSFAVWGVEDMVRTGIGQGPAITVGEVDIGAEDVRARFERDVDRLRGLFGPQMTLDAARQMGLLDNTVRAMVGDATLDMAGRALAVSVTKEGLQEAIIEEPAFHNGGKFDKSQYLQVLAANRLTEQAYVADLTRTLLRTRLVGSVAGNGSAPAPLADLLFAYRQERRGAESLVVNAAALPLDTAPEEDDLRRLYDAAVEHEFTAPEYRTLSLVLIRPQDVDDRIEIDEQAIADHYAAHADQFSTPETRSVVQVLTDSEDAARQVADRARASGAASLADAAAAVGAPAPVALGTIAADDLPDEQAAAVFALAAGEVSAPLASPFGWHVFAVETVTPGQVRSLDEAREAIRAELKQERAIDALYQVSAELDDALGGGASLEEAAKGLGLQVIAIAATDADGRAPDGAPAAGLPPGAAGAAVLQAAAPLEAGRESRVADLPEAGGYFVVRADAIQPPAPRPFESVRPQLVARWQADARQARAEALAKELLAKVEGGATLAELAAADPAVLSLRRHPALTRDGAPAEAAGDGAQPLPAAQAAALFALAGPGSATVVSEPGGAAVLRLTAVQAADPATGLRQRQALDDELRQALGADLAEAVVRAWSDRFGVHIDRAAIERAF